MSGCVTASERILAQVEIVRKQSGVTYHEIATQIGTTDSTISRIASGKQTLTVDWLEKIANALDTDVSSLVAPLQRMPQDYQRHRLAEQVSDIKLLAMLIEQLTGRELINSEVEVLSYAAKKMLASVLTLELAVQEMQT